MGRKPLCDVAIWCVVMVVGDCVNSNAWQEAHQPFDWTLSVPDDLISPRDDFRTKDGGVVHVGPDILLPVTG